MSGRGKRSRVQPQPTDNRLTSATWRPSLPDLAIGLGLFVAILIVYSRVAHFDFITYDDDLHVYQNPHVQEGLTLASIQYAFTAVVSNNWIPVTMLSHIVAAQFFHLDSGAHHLVNVALHALSAVLLFMVLRRATRTRWPCAFVAAMFALHPLHVGSVAWVSERKDVLSAFFWFAALYCYLLYAERGTVGRYLAVLGCFALGLMSKPMLVTLPFTLLLFDFWPLRRVRWPRILWEKLPFFALSAIDAAVTYFVQQSGGAVQAIPLGTRIANALISYVVYIGQMFWPAGLALIYPYPKSIAPIDVVFSAALIVGMSALAIITWRTRPYLAFGWFWYLGTLVPVIGLIQVGVQSHADRYTYIPMIGLSLILAWGAADVIARWPRSKSAIAAAGAIACGAWMVLAWQQTTYWENSGTLYQQAINVTHDNWVAEYNLGHYLMTVPGRASDAITHFEAALRIQPDYPEADNNLGTILMNSGRNAEAIPHFEAALRARPDFADVHFNLGLALSNLHGHDSEAMAQYQAALRLRPDQEMAHNNLGLLLVKQGRTNEAIPHFEAAVRLNPDYRNEHNLGVIFLTLPGRQADALVHLEAAQRLHPDPEIANLIAGLRAAKK